MAAKHLEKKHLSPQLHAAIQAFYQSKYGPLAGWAQSLVFMQALKRAKKAE